MLRYRIQTTVLSAKTRIYTSASAKHEHQLPVDATRPTHCQHGSSPKTLELGSLASVTRSFSLGHFLQDSCPLNIRLRKPTCREAMLPSSGLPWVDIRGSPKHPKKIPPPGQSVAKSELRREARAQETNERALLLRVRLEEGVQALVLPPH